MNILIIVRFQILKMCLCLTWIQWLMLKNATFLFDNYAWIGISFGKESLFEKKKTLFFPSRNLKFVWEVR